MAGQSSRICVVMVQQLVAVQCIGQHQVAILLNPFLLIVLVTLKTD